LGKELARKLEQDPHPARLWEPHPRDPGRVICRLSPRNCEISEGGSGFCGVRRNVGGRLVTLNYGKMVRPTEEVIETEAVFHYAPGEPVLSLGNLGCTMICDFCHNWKTSQARLVRDRDVHEHSADELLDLAERLGIRVLSWTYDDPVVWHEFVLDTARKARERGMKNLYKSAFFISPEGVDELLDVIDIFSVSLKSMDPEFYRKHTGGRLEPVLAGIERVHKAGRHLELSNLLVTGRNDRLEESEKVARFILDKLDASVPLHYVRFHPDYKYTGVERTSIPFMERARGRAKGLGLKNVYLGNILESESLNTRCVCGELLVRRYGLFADTRLDAQGLCPACGADPGIRTLPPRPTGAPVGAIPHPDFVDHAWEEDRLSVHIVSADGEPLYTQALDHGGSPVREAARSRGPRFMASKSHPKEQTLRVYFKGTAPKIMPLLDRAYYPVEDGE